MTAKRHKKIRHKLMACFLAIAGLSVLVLAVGIAGLLKIVANTYETFDYTDDRDRVGRMLITMHHQESCMQSLLLYLDDAPTLREKLMELNAATESQIAIIGEMEGHQSTISQTEYDYLFGIFRQQLAPGLEQLTRQLQAGGEKVELETLMRELLVHSGEMINVLDRLFSSIDADQSEGANATIAISWVLIATFGVLGMLTVAASVVFGNVQAARISNPIDQMAKLAERISIGDIHDISLNVTSEDELGILSDALKQMAHSISDQAHLLERMAQGDYLVDVEVRSQQDVANLAMKKVIGETGNALYQIGSSTDQFVQTAEQIAQEAQELAANAHQQVTHIEVITQSIAGLERQTKENAELSQEASLSNHEAGEVFQQAINSMKDVLKAMEGIEESTNNITQIIRVIEDIAFQTNILALNASVEAARAGQQGKGFAVVADEVRNLASKSDRAAKETAELIAQCANKVQQGNRSVSETNRHLTGAIENAGQSYTVLERVSKASLEQASEIQAISGNIMEISSAAQQNSSAAQLFATVSEELSAQSVVLKGITSRFSYQGGSREMPKQSVPPVAGAVHRNDTVQEFSLSASGQKY